MLKNTDAVNNDFLLNMLMYNYFGIGLEDCRNADICDASKEQIMFLCANRAYADLQRTISYNDIIKGDSGSADRKRIAEKERLNFRSEGSKLICQQIRGLFGNELSKDTYISTCNVIINFAKGMVVSNDAIVALEELKENKGRSFDNKCILKKDTFSFGKAQKWFNMTIKYMWLFRLWKEELTPIVNAGYIPVDSTIIKIVREKWREKKGYGCSRRQCNEQNVIIPAKAWSTWNADEYFNFIKSIYKIYSKTPADMFKWEYESWLEVVRTKRNMKLLNE